jgi:hypothetical protein
MRLSHPLVSGALLAVAHFAVCLAIVPLTLKLGEALPGRPADSLLYGLLAGTTKGLYFPILSLALYPRHWFPGQLITIPIAVNSLLWGAVLALAIWMWHRLRSGTGR